MIESRIILPTPDLRPFVHHYWILESDAPMSQTILPMGCMKWILHRKKPFIVNQFTTPDASVCGQYERAVHTVSHGDMEMIGVFFHPYSAGFALNIPCNEFLEANIDFDSLGDDKMLSLRDRVLNSPTSINAVAIIEQHLIDRLAMSGNLPYLNRLAAVFSHMEQNPDTHIDTLASIACLSERQFRRVFSSYVGITPKQLLRIRRLALATGSLIKNGTGIVRNLPPQYGFTDLSHLNHEFHDFIGMSPTEFLRHLHALKQRGILQAYRSYHNTP